MNETLFFTPLSRPITDHSTDRRHI